MNARTILRPLKVVTAAVATAVLVVACADGSADPVDDATAAPEEVGEGSIEGMRVLLTNDDSMQASNEANSDGLGLYEMRKALCEAGADVVILAPWAVQSGQGTAVTNSGVLTAAAADVADVGEEYVDDCATASGEGAVFGLCADDGSCGEDSVSATPADTVKFALRGGLADLVGWDEYPDLVVTGPNSGINVASSVNDSGTLGSAIAGVEHHVPAVAFSTSDDADGVFPVENYRATAEWAVELLTTMSAHSLLEHSDFVTSVNYPDASGDDPIGAATFVEVGHSAFAWHYYTNTDGETYEIGLEICEGKDLCEETKDNADWQTVLEDGAIGIGAIAPDRSYGPDAPVSGKLQELRTFVEESAPEPIQ